MSKFLRPAAMLPAMLCLTVTAMAAKPATKSKPNPKQKPTTNHATKGTTQLNGMYAQIGSTYTLGKASPINITLKSAEFTVAQVVIGDQVYFPSAEEKLLVLHYTLHNPLAEEQLARYDTFSATAVDSKNENHEYTQDFGVEATKLALSMNLKPAQKVDGYALIKVPAKGEIPKLILASSDNLVLRYDLRGKVKPLAAPFADPSDATGASALSTAPAKVGESYPLSNFDFALNGTSFSDKALPDSEPAEGNRYLVVSVTAKNVAPTEQLVRYDTFRAVVKDTDDADIESGDVLLASRNAPASTELKPGQEMKVRIFFEVPKDLSFKTLSISEMDSHVLEYDMSAVK